MHMPKIPLVLRIVAIPVIAAGLGWAFTRDNSALVGEGPPLGNTVSVVIAANELRAGVPIAATDLAVRAGVPGTMPAEGTYASPAELVGRTPRERILPLEPIRSERLSDAGAGIGLNALLAPGKRAMTVSTTTEDAASGLLLPGNRVDIIVTSKPNDSAGSSAKWTSETILRAVRVLAAGGSLAENGPRRLTPSITLELSPEEAETLAAASSEGEIHVVLRSDLEIAAGASPPTPKP